MKKEVSTRYEREKADHFEEKASDILFLSFMVEMWTAWVVDDHEQLLLLSWVLVEKGERLWKRKLD